MVVRGRGGSVQVRLRQMQSWLSRVMDAAWKDRDRHLSSPSSATALDRSPRTGGAVSARGRHDGVGAAKAKAGVARNAAEERISRSRSRS